MSWPPAPITDPDTIARYLPRHLRLLAEEDGSAAARRLTRALRGRYGHPVTADTAT